MNIKPILGVIELILGVYLLNNFFNWVTIPAFILVKENWILLVCAIILIILAFLTFIKKTAILSNAY